MRIEGDISLWKMNAAFCDVDYHSINKVNSQTIFADMKNGSVRSDICGTISEANVDEILYARLKANRHQTARKWVVLNSAWFIV